MNKNSGSNRIGTADDKYIVLFCSNTERYFIIDRISKIFHPDRIGFCKSLSPFSRAFVQNRFLPRWHSLIFYSKLLGAFLCRRYSAAFSPTNKMYFICSKEKKIHTVCRYLILWIVKIHI